MNLNSANRLEIMDAARPWMSCFEINEDQTAADLGIAVDMLSLSRSELYTGKIPYTQHMIASIRTGDVQVLGRDADKPSWHDATEILCLIATHSLIARSRKFKVQAPAFWIRTDGDKVRPVMPIDQLETVSGKNGADIRAILPMLSRDGAIRILRGPDGTAGVCLNDGYIHDRDVRRFLRA